MPRSCAGCASSSTFHGPMPRRARRSGGSACPRTRTQLDDAAFRQLARKIDLTGGHIRQITLRAAFIAAAAGTQIDLEHIAHAARAEFAKLGMPPVELDPKSGEAGGMKADAILRVTEALRERLEVALAASGVPGTRLRRAARRCRRERRGADSVPLPHRPEPKPAQSRASRAGERARRRSACSRTRCRSTSTISSRSAPSRAPARRRRCRRWASSCRRCRRSRS